MKRSIAIAAAALALTGCSMHHNNQKNPYEGRVFYQKYLVPGNPLDSQITRNLNDLRANPRSAALHNNLGQLLVSRGFPKDAETEFERAINNDSHFYPAWYNLGLLRMARGDWMGARIAFRQTIRYKPGHSVALFQLGLMEEQRHNTDDAIDYYARAFSINHTLLDVRVNPRIVDSKLVDLALLRLYPKAHARESMAFQPAPGGYVQQNLEAPSTQPAAQQIVTPSAPVTDPARQTPPPSPGQAPAPSQPQPQPARPPQPATTTAH